MNEYTENSADCDQAYGLTQDTQEEAVPAERAVLSNLFGIMLAVKTIYPQAKTDAQRIELLTSVFQVLLERFEEHGVHMDLEAFAATAMGLSNIASEEWA